MNRLVLLFFLAAALAFAQTTPVSVTVTFQNADIADIYTWAHQQWSDPATSAAALSAAMAAGDTSLTLASTAGYPASGAVFIDSEVILYSAISGNQLTGLTRGQQQTTAAAHLSGALVHVLSIATPNQFVGFCVARQIQSIRLQLGASGAAVGAAVTSLNAATATVNSKPTVTTN